LIIGCASPVGREILSDAGSDGGQTGTDSGPPDGSYEATPDGGADAGPQLCNPQDAIDILNICLQAVLWEPGLPCDSLDGGGTLVPPPSNYFGGSDFAQRYQARCEQLDQGPFISCYASACRTLSQIYRGSGVTPLNAMAQISLEWCAPVSTAPQRPASCVQTCDGMSVYETTMIVPCGGTTWSACESCEQGEYEGLESCTTACGLDSCDDGMQDDGESDIDCGGTICRACLDGQKCMADSDCRSLHCVQGACAAATCFDGVQNEFETDVDCGAFCNQPCGSGQHCAANSDCESGDCSGQSYGNLGNCR
jgi:hypothetical protein